MEMAGDNCDGDQALSRTKADKPPLLRGLAENIRTAKLKPTQQWQASCQI